MFAGLRKYIPLLALIVGMSLYLNYQFEEVIKCPSCHLFVNSGDGLKNYFTPAYYVKHDPAGLWFNGMNYPYGEHVVYTDNQPIISMLMKAAGALFDMDEHIIGTINLLMIISVLLASLCIFALLRTMDIPRWYAAVMSIPIALLSPQIARVNGHFSLAYAFYIPLFLLLLVRWANARFEIKKGALLTAWIVFMGFTHLYYFFIAIIFLACFAFVHFLLGRFRWSKSMTGSLIVILVSAFIVYGTVKSTDPVTDRPETVYGIDVYTAKSAGAFVPWFSPSNEVTKKWGFIKPDIEGTSYIGAPAVLLLPFLLIFALYAAIRRYGPRRKVKHARSRLNAGSGQVFILFFSGLLVWFIATGWMYQIGGGILIEWFPVIGQFRSLGRLAWIFYYIMGISTAYIMYVFVRHTRHRFARIGLIALFMVFTTFWIWEGHAYIEDLFPDTGTSVNKTFRGGTPFSDVLAANGLEADDFQGILQLPLESVGAEKISIPRGGWFMRQSWQSAWETGLPIINSMMSRTSISQTLSLIQLLSDPYIAKRRLDDMDDRPLLLLASIDVKPLIKSEKRIIALGDSIGVVNDVRVYTLPISSFLKSAEPRTVNPIISLDYDDQETALSFSGQGALLTEQPRTETFSFVDTFTTRKVLEYSSWSHLGPLTPVFVSVRHEVFNAAGDRLKRDDFNMFKYNPHNVIGDWIETRFFFSVDGSGAVHKFYAEPAGSWIDQIQIR